MKTALFRLASPVAALALGMVTQGSLRAAVIVSPGDFTSTEGGASSLIPTDIGDGDAAQSFRYQQVFKGSDFSLGPVEISALSFRPDSAGTGFAATSLTSFEIRLSTTTVAVDALSTTFASNRGGDEQVVLTGGATVSSTFTPGSSPKNFDITFTFSSPFLYNPANGNLLMEIIGGSAHVTSPVDQVSYGGVLPGNRVSSAFALDSTATVADFTESSGLVTSFSITPVPEPESIAWVSAAALGLGALVIRRRK